MRFFRKKGGEETQPKPSRSLSSKKGKRVLNISIDKRQKFVLAVIVLSIGLFVAEFQFGKSGIIIALLLGIITDLFLYWSVREDLKGNFAISLFILPFFYSLAFGLFYFLVPARLMFRLLLTGLYAFGMYSLFLSENIFIVSSIRTIALLSGARIVSFVITLISFFFLTNTIYTLHVPVYFIIPIFLVYTFPLLYQSIWTYILQKTPYSIRLWSLALTVSLAEAASIIWFWPTSPTVIALFLTGFLYTLVGLSHAWFEKRLFRSVMWEYVWVGAMVFFVIILFTSWGK
jgi:hypothetical protein